ncbi:hypothetical protein EON67_02600 [archaeon]|nr:MAG: hypothetical protein EON67_02600 [archaeon]
MSASCVRALHKRAAATTRAATMSSKEAARPACKDHASQLALCVEDKSPCVRVQGRSIVDCIKAGEIGDCELHNKAYAECRRSQLDMRTRLRGRRFQDVG